METTNKLKGSRGQRSLITFLAIVFAVLFFWLLGFLTDDIGSMKGPDFELTKVKHVDAELENEKKALDSELAKIKRDINNKKEQRAILKDSTNNLQNTIKQLLEIQKQSLEKGLKFPAESSDTLAKSQGQFLENQKEYQALNSLIGDLTSTQQGQKNKLLSISESLEEQNKEARKEYNELWKVHRMKVAVLKLAALLPLFLAASWLFIKKRSTKYAPLIYAAFITIFIKVSLVAHEYFPSKYFKYAAILVVIGVVIKILVYLITRISAPKKDWLIKQYQEAYDKYACPICTKPMRIGPLRYVTNLKSKVLNAAGIDSESLQQQPYTCPSCGMDLYENCDACGKVCHSLLPFCEHCGKESKS